MSTSDHMLAKVLASLLILVLLFINVAATMWFVFGLWPKSWAAYVAFNVMSLLLVMLMKLLD